MRGKKNVVDDAEIERLVDIYQGWLGHYLTPSQLTAVQALSDGQTETNGRLAARMGWSPSCLSAMKLTALDRLRQIDRLEASLGSASITVLLRHGLSWRVFSALKRAGLVTIEQVSALSDEDLRYVRRLGPSGVQRLRAALAAWQKGTRDRG